MVVWDSYLDLCYWKSRLYRSPTRCELSRDIIVERRLYNGTVPFWCISLNNDNDAYSTMKIEFDGNSDSRKFDKYYANQLQTGNDMELVFGLLNEKVEIVIYPRDSRFQLQKILSIKLNDVEMCDENRINEIDHIYPNQLNTNAFRYLNHCTNIIARSNRAPDDCEQLDNVIIEKLLFNTEIPFYCVVIENQNNDSTIEMRISNGMSMITHTPKANQLLERQGTYRKWNFIRNSMSIAIFPKNEKVQLANILSLKINGVESCKTNTMITPTMPSVSIITTTPQPSQHKAKCGQLKILHQSLAFFGLPTYEGEFPWHVALYYLPNRSTRKYICGGSILNTDTILTAGHCLLVGNEKGVADSFLVAAGKFVLSKNTDNSIERFVREIIFHENFDKERLENDIALLKLKTLITYSAYIQPICITDNLNKFENNIGTVAGWGISELLETEDVLQKVSMPVVSNSDCRKSNRDFYIQFLNEHSFCAGFRNGSTVCKGDSGGGLIFQLNDGWYLKGIVSLSPASNISICDIYEYVVFTDVTKFYRWITSQVFTDGDYKQH